LLNKKVQNNFLVFCTYNKIRSIKVQTILHKITEVRSNINQQFFQLYSKLVLAKQSNKFDNLTGGTYLPFYQDEYNQHKLYRLELLRQATEGMEIVS